jgi:hypothetical protein
MEYVLVLVFLVNDGPMFNTSLLPEFYPTYEECEIERIRINALAEKNSAYPYVVGCYKKEPTGKEV